jgi:outer membrane immunogenic protein
LAAVAFGGSAALSALLGGPVAAADLPVATPPPASQPVSLPTAPPEFTWTGCYVGGNGGGLWVKNDSTFAGPTYAGSPAVGTSLGGHTASGWLAGFQVGCDYQVSNWVFGAQGAFGWSDAQGSHRDPFFAATDSSRTDQLMEMTWRGGYAWHQFLGYVKVGGGWERINYVMTMDSTGDANANTRETGGWIVGVGGEYAITQWLSAFIEYEHYDFGTANQTFLSNATYIANVNEHDTKDAVKAGFNLRF